VAALLDAAEADNAVAEGLIAKGNPTILQFGAAAEARGIAESILEVLEERGVAVSLAQREEILGCSDIRRLKRWVRRAEWPLRPTRSRPSPEHPHPVLVLPVPGLSPLAPDLRLRGLKVGKRAEREQVTWHRTGRISPARSSTAWPHASRKRANA
jgi:hypothetical protein